MCRWVPAHNVRVCVATQTSFWVMRTLDMNSRETFLNAFYSVTYEKPDSNLLYTQECGSRPCFWLSMALQSWLAWQNNLHPEVLLCSKMLLLKDTDSKECSPGLVTVNREAAAQAEMMAAVLHSLSEMPHVTAMPSVHQTHLGLWIAALIFGLSVWSGPPGTLFQSLSGQLPGSQWVSVSNYGPMTSVQNRETHLCLILLINTSIYLHDWELPWLGCWKEVLCVSLQKQTKRTLLCTGLWFWSCFVFLKTPMWSDSYIRFKRIIPRVQS